MRWKTLWILTSLTVGCGAFEDRYIDYKKTSGVEGVSGTDEGEEFFGAQLASSINSCISSGCHASIKIGGNLMVSGDAASARSALLTYQATSEQEAQSLTVYPFNSGHSGSSVASGIEGLADTFEEWLELEQVSLGQGLGQVDEGDTSFQALIAPSIGGCIVSGCHATIPIAGGSLETDNDTLNAATLRNYQKTKAEEKGNIWDYVVSDDHNGKAKASSTGLDSKLETWLEAHPDSDS